MVDNIPDNIPPTTLSGVISGTGSITQNGSDTFVLSGKNTYSGGTYLNAGVVSVKQEGNLGTGTLTFDGGTLKVTGTHFKDTTKTINWGAKGGAFDIDDADNTFTLSNVFTGSGALTKYGAGILALTGDSSGYKGNTTVSEGKLRLDGGMLGDGTGTVQVASGAALGGHGSIGGSTDIATGATLLGQSGQKLTFDKDLTLNAGSKVNVTLGAPSINGLFDVKGNLTVDGTLNITDAGGFGPGLYRIFDYSGTLTNNGLAIGTVQGGDASQVSLQTSVDNQINLVNTAGVTLNFWDGDDLTKHDNNHIDGGSGTWNTTNDNWTDKDGELNGK